jgi:hypothetical protein
MLRLKAGLRSMVLSYTRFVVRFYSLILTCSCSLCSFKYDFWSTGALLPWLEAIKAREAPISGEETFAKWVAVFG